MSLIYVTGVSGAGKSTVRQGLVERGYEAHDTDEDGFRGWYDLKTKKYVNAQVGYDDASKEWLRRYQLRIHRDPVEILARRADDKIIFMCGTTPNDKDVLDLFNKVIYLIISEDTLRDRIRNRTNNKFGKDPEEFEAILGWHKDSEVQAEKFGAICIDAQQPIEQVVNQVIEAANSST